MKQQENNLVCLCVARLYKVSHITVQKKSEEKECHSKKEKKDPKFIVG